jgi:hypothetical protein
VKQPDAARPPEQIHWRAVHADDPVQTNGTPSPRADPSCGPVVTLTGICEQVGGAQPVCSTAMFF